MVKEVGVTKLFKGISVCMPTYKGTDIVTPTLASILAQDYADFEIIVCNDSVGDHEQMARLVQDIGDARIKFYPNDRNLGYPHNLRRCVSLASNELIFLMGQDDLILGKDVFSRIVDIYNKNPNIGVITRPYYWFFDKENLPNRKSDRCDRTIISVKDELPYIQAIFQTVGQLSGLVYRKSLITHQFNENVFTAHIYPFLSVLKTHDCYFWEKDMIAVRTATSQTRFLSSIYRPSPTKTWMEMFCAVFPEPEFRGIRDFGIDLLGRNYVGLAQIKNYGHYQDLLVDILYLIKYRPINLLSPLFWFFVIGSIIVPRNILRKAVDVYKSRVNRLIVQ